MDLNKRNFINRSKSNEIHWIPSNMFWTK